MNTEIIKKYKYGRKIICYIKKCNDIFKLYTGKPSDVTCFSWSFDNYTACLLAANEYYNNYTSAANLFKNNK